MRTQQEIDRHIQGLIALKKTLPEYNFFGDENWLSIDAQISILKGDNEVLDFEHHSDHVYNAAQEAQDYLDGYMDTLID